MDIHRTVYLLPGHFVRTDYLGILQAGQIECLAGTGAGACLTEHRMTGGEKRQKSPAWHGKFAMNLV